MKKLIILFCLAFASPAFAANVNIDGLPAASSVNGTDLYECEQGGVNNKCTPAQMSTYLQGTNAFGLVSGSITANDLLIGGPGASQFQDAANATGAVTIAPTALQGQRSPSAAPSTLCSTGNYLNAFYPACDTSGTVISAGSHITGATTLGNPTATYQANPSLAIDWSYLQNQSGVNSGTSGTGPGRTNIASKYMKVDQLGQGDGGAMFADIFVNNAKSGATSFLANPAGFILGGQVIAGQAGVYLQPLGDLNCSDGGFDVACISAVFNLTRTVATGALGATWLGARIQSKGSAAIDAAFSATGPANIGVDLASVTLGANASAITLPVAGRVYTAATGGTFFPSSVGTDYFMSPAAGKFRFVIGGTDRLDFNDTTASAWALNGTLNMTNGNLLIASSSVIGMRSSNTPISSPANATVHLGSLDAAAPVAQTFGVQGVVAGTSNANGANWTLAGSVSTGTGTSGDIIFQTGGTGAGTTAQNTLTNALVIKGATQNVQLPAVATGTPTASLCLDASGNIIKKTTSGACI